MFRRFRARAQAKPVRAVEALPRSSSPVSSPIARKILTATTDQDEANRELALEHQRKLARLKAARGGTRCNTCGK